MTVTIKQKKPAYLAHKKIPKASLEGYHGLTKDEVLLINDDLRNGASLHSVANRIRTEFGKATSVTRTAVILKLQAYRDRFLGKGIVLAAARLDGEYKQEVLDRIKEDVDVLTELATLVAIQRRRVDRLVSHETAHQKILVETTSAIRLMADMLGQVGSLQLELGILTRVPKTVLAATVSAPSPSDSIATPEYQHRLLSIMGLLGQEAVATEN